MPAQAGRSSVANGNIRPYRAIKIDATTDNRVIEAGSGDLAIGIAGKYTRYAPWATINDGFLAIAGENVQYWADGENNVPALLGSAVTAGDLVGVGANAALETVTSGSAKAIGIAKMSGVAGDVINIDVSIQTT